jgi:hypothetical protein
MLTIRGVYTGKDIKLLEDVHVRPNVRVLVTFLDDEPVTPEIDEDTEGLLALSGTWEDDRPVEAIVRDIYESRTTGKEEVVL